MSEQPLTRLILVRHGETLANRTYRYIGTRNDELSEQGTLQAERLAEALASLPVAAVYSSPLLRTRATAIPIAARHALDVQIVEKFSEGHFGAWEGMTRAEVLAKSKEDGQQLLAWESDPSVAPPGGESFAQLQTRVLQEVTELTRLHPEQIIVLVSHVGPIKVLLSAALGAPLTSIYNLFLDPATISVIDWREPHPLVRLFNSHAHLGWEQARWMKI